MAALILLAVAVGAPLLSVWLFAESRRVESDGWVDVLGDGIRDAEETRR